MVMEGVISQESVKNQYESYINVLLYVYRTILKRSSADLINHLQNCLYPRLNLRRDLLMKSKPLDKIRLGLKMQSVQIPIDIDDNSTVLVHKSVVKNLSLTNGDLVAVYFHTGHRQYSKRICRLYGVSAVGTDVCYVAPSLHNNINRHRTVTKLCIGRCRSFKGEMATKNLISPLFSPDTNSVSALISDPCRAVSVSFSLIEYHTYSSDVQFEISLRNYFNLPRIVVEGDILNLPYSLSDSSKQHSSNIYIKITSVTCLENCKPKMCHLAQYGESKFYFSGCIASISIPIDDKFLDYEGNVIVPMHMKPSYETVYGIVRSQIEANFCDETHCSGAGLKSLEQVLNTRNKTKTVQQSEKLKTTFSKKVAVKIGIGHVLLVGDDFQVRIFYENF